MQQSVCPTSPPAVKADGHVIKADLTLALATASVSAGGNTSTAALGQDVVGRRLKLCRGKASTGRGSGWEEAQVREWDAASGAHKVKFVADKSEEWLVLAASKYKWLTDVALGDPTSPTAQQSQQQAPSPPKRDAAVGRRVRVLWPQMGRYYTGVVRSFDPVSGKHRIDYKDGDSVEHILRNETITWLDEPEPHLAAPNQEPPAVAKCPVQEPSGQRDENAATAAASCPTSAPVACGDKPSASTSPAQVVVAACAVPITASSGNLTQGSFGSGKADASAATAARLMGAAPVVPAAVDTGGPAATMLGDGRTPSAIRAMSSCGPPTRTAAAAGTMTSEAGTTASAATPLGVTSVPVRAYAPRQMRPASAGAAPLKYSIPATTVSKAPVTGPEAQVMPDACLVAGSAAAAPATTPAAQDVGSVACLEAPERQAERQAVASGGELPTSSTGLAAQPQTFSGAQPGGTSRTSRGGRTRMRNTTDQAASDAQRGCDPLAEGNLASKRGSGAADASTSTKRPRRAAVAHRVAAGLVGCSAQGLELRSLAVGTRIGVYWDEDETFYRGKLTGYASATGKYQVRYDDGECEWLSLDQEQFSWYCPRGRSAGYRTALHSVMAGLGASNIVPNPGPEQPEQQPPGAAAPTPASPEECVGRRLSLYWQGDAGWHAGEVLSYNRRTGRHHILYQDGEDEWLELAKEAVGWLPTKTQRGGSSTLSAGLQEGQSVPSGRGAVGWRIAVYWKDDMTFYEGRIASYDSATGRHSLVYDDGENEMISLHGEKIVWRLPPGVGADVDRVGGGSSDSDDSDLSGPPRTTTSARNKRRRSRISAEEYDGSSSDADHHGSKPPRPRQRRRTRVAPNSDPAAPPAGRAKPITAALPDLMAPPAPPSKPGPATTKAHQGSLPSHHAGASAGGVSVAPRMVDGFAVPRPVLSSAPMAGVHAAAPLRAPAGTGLTGGVRGPAQHKGPGSHAGRRAGRGHVGAGGTRDAADWHQPGLHSAFKGAQQLPPAAHVASRQPFPPLPGGAAFAGSSGASGDDASCPPLELPKILRLHVMIDAGCEEATTAGKIGGHEVQAGASDAPLLLRLQKRQAALELMSRRIDAAEPLCDGPRTMGSQQAHAGFAVPPAPTPHFAVPGPIKGSPPWLPAASTSMMAGKHHAGVTAEASQPVSLLMRRTMSRAVVPDVPPVPPAAPTVPLTTVGSD